MADAAHAAATSATAGDIVCAANIAENPYKRDFPLLANHPTWRFWTAPPPRSAQNRARRAAPLLRGDERERTARPVPPVRRSHRGHRDRPPARGEVHRRPRCARHRAVAQRLRVAQHRGEGLRPHRSEPGDEVCITIMEHHSNLIPWQQACRAAGAKLVYLYPDENGVITPEEMDAKIGPKTKILSVVHVSNVLGVQNPVEELGRRACTSRAATSWSTARSPRRTSTWTCRPSAPTSSRSPRTSSSAPSAWACCGAKTELLNAMPPFLTGGEMIDSVTEQDATWAPVPEKFEAGTQDAAGIYATAAAIAYVESVGIDVIEAREKALVRYCMEEMASSALRHHHRQPRPEHAPWRHQLQRRRHPPARRGQHPRHGPGGHPRRPSLRAAAAHLAGRGEPCCCARAWRSANDKGDVDKLIEGLGNVWRTFNG